MERDLLTTAEVALQLGVSDETIRRWVRKGVIGYTLVGPFRLKRIPKAEVEKQKIEVRGADSGPVDEKRSGAGVYGATSRLNPLDAGAGR